ncbi:por [Drosophila busckii]|uniref:Protein-serine O-palmitoleoyltransferase porcupine n=1 Tax=Drosophila busckii TaxID=30019 RepID=A0A0M4EW21_DROBS|nr:protein-serine O-palmitoleoyltransferase porcupine [Drosophila busckii]ALC49572.1 por [Drosophila busckii]
MDYQYYDDQYYADDDAGDEDVEDEEDYGEAVLMQTSVKQRLMDSYNACVLPSLSQVASYITPLLFGCLLCRLLCMLYARRQRLTTNQQQANSLKVAPLHLINLFCGAGMLYATLGEDLLLLFLVLSLVGYALLQLVRLRLAGSQMSAIAIAVLSIGSQFAYELWLVEKRGNWPQLRGLQMVANMKLISLGFDLTEATTSSSSSSSSQAQRMPSLLAYMGYICQPASCALGPWISYRRYLDSLCAKSIWLRTLFQLLLNLLLCLLALSVSNCFAPALSEFHLPSEMLQRHFGSQWLHMYTGSLSVRSSHYFISWLSQALIAAAGLQLDSAQRSALLGELVTQAWHIEWPRSLSALVRSWNMPMHEWLKRYVYVHAAPSDSDCCNRPRSRLRTLIAVVCTYVVSSLLHGMDFRIYVVLLSLAVFAEGESMLRRHLALLCDACIAANPCRGMLRCHYTHCPERRGWRCFSSWVVELTNLGFRLLAIGHLAYLGVVLFSETFTTSGSGGGGGSLSDELGFIYHWSAAGYLSHYVGLGMFVLYLFIS